MSNQNSSPQGWGYGQAGQAGQRPYNPYAAPGQNLPSNRRSSTRKARRKTGLRFAAGFLAVIWAVFVLELVFPWLQGFGILFDDLVAAGCTLLVMALWRAW